MISDVNWGGGGVKTERLRPGLESSCIAIWIALMNLVVRRGGTFIAATVASGRLLCLLDEAENVTCGMVVGQERLDVTRFVIR